VFTPAPYPGAGAEGEVARMRSWLLIALACVVHQGCRSPRDVESPLADFDGRIDRIGDRLSGNVIAHMSPGSPRLPVVGSVSGRDVRLWFGSDFVFSGTIDDTPDAATGAIAVSGVLIGPDVGPVPERLTLR
jgi:hypothetical protein